VVEQHKQEAAHNEALGVDFERYKKKSPEYGLLMIKK
jgi:hypothetical protein